MIISGLQRLSLLDYPDLVACVVFTAGCNLRCGFCHNSEFVLPDKIARLKEEILQEKLFFSFLEKRIGILDGVSICGGEPTLHSDLPEFCAKIHSLGFQVKLDTNGTNPEMLELLIERQLVDYIAMDIKHTWQEYDMISGKHIPKDVYEKSIRLIMSRSPDYEFRTTIIAGKHTKNHIQEIVSYIQGAKAYYLQNYRPGETLDPGFLGSSFTENEMIQFQTMVKEETGMLCNIRL